ncbi:MAG: peptidase, partial [Rubripirellula sp.]
SPGAVRNLPTLNDSVLGGLAPGIVIQNNTIDQAEYAGIKIDGEIAPLAIIPPDGDSITDGSTFVIDAAGTRVIFEFEDISQGIIPTNYPEPYGSATDGGDGVRDGHVPVYIRHTDSNPASVYRGRVTPYTATEVANSIRESIQGSILMSNSLAELVEVEIGPWLGSTGTGFDETFTTPAVYVKGASGIYRDPDDAFSSNAFFGVGIAIAQAPLAEAPQPFARIVNNTIYGDDGTESNFPQNATTEPSDFLSQAIDTKLGSSHRGPYLADATSGNGQSRLDSAIDVDFYRVYLEVGDRLVVDIDTIDADPNDAAVVEGPDTVLRIFDSSGVAVGFQDRSGNFVTINDADTAPQYLDPRSGDGDAATDANRVSDAVNVRDPFADFTAQKTGTYFVGVSSAGNDQYDPASLSGRVPGTGGSGVYDIGIEVYAPRSFVISADSNNNGSTSNNPGPAAETDRAGIRGSDIIGTTFTVTQIQDLTGFAQGDTDANGIKTNEIVFQFVAGTGGGTVQTPSGLVTIQVGDDYRLPDIMSTIELALGGATFQGSPLVPNDSENRGPIPASKAAAAGGIDASSAIIADLGPRTFRTSDGIVDNELFYAQDFNTDGFGHRMILGSTEQYVFIENVANITLSPEAIAAGLNLDPVSGRDIDQLINETGVMVAGGASPTLLNNVFLNLHESVVMEETRLYGFGQASRGSDQHPKPMEVIVVSSVFQHDETIATEFNQNMVFSRFRDAGLTTSAGE